MTVTTNDARQGETIKNNRIAKIVLISTVASFVALALIAAGF